MYAAAIFLMVLSLVAGLLADNGSIYPVLWRIGFEPAAFVSSCYVAAACFAALAFLVTVIRAAVRRAGSFLNPRPVRDPRILFVVPVQVYASFLSWRTAFLARGRERSDLADRRAHSRALYAKYRAAVAGRA